MMNYLIALILTQVIELTVAIILGYRDKWSILTILCINVITNPALNLLLYLGHSYDILSYDFMTLNILELTVVLIEWCLLMYTLGGNKYKLLFLAFAINAISYLSGLVIYLYI